VDLPLKRLPNSEANPFKFRSIKGGRHSDKELSKWSKESKMGMKEACFYMREVMFLAEKPALVAFFLLKRITMRAW